MSTATIDALGPLLAVLEASAVRRDRQGGHASAEKALLREAGLLRHAIPARFGGDEAPWPEVYRTVRRLAAVDSALAHLLAFHHLQVATLLIYATPEQQQRWLADTARHGLWWGNAMNPLDARLVHTPGPQGDGFQLDGTKGFCSGSRGSDCLTVSALAPQAGGLLLGALRTAAPGIAVDEDWDAIGQRQTDSGTVHFEAVHLPARDVLRRPDATPTVRHSLRTCLGQLVLVHLYAGIAEGALAQARTQSLALARPWIASGVQRAADDPYRLARFGEMHLHASSAAVMADRATQLLQHAWLAGDAVSAAQRREVAVAIAEAKVLAHRASLAVSQALFETVGARAAQAPLGLDRFWRNARTHTLHDPLDYKLRALGQWALEGEFPSDLYT